MGRRLGIDCCVPISICSFGYFCAILKFGAVGTPGTTAWLGVTARSTISALDDNRFVHDFYNLFFPCQV